MLPKLWHTLSVLHQHFSKIPPFQHLAQTEPTGARRFFSLAFTLYTAVWQCILLILWGSLL